MKRFLLMTMLCGALTGGFVLAADKETEKESPKTPATRPATQPATPINKFCAVDRDNAIDITAGTVVYEGKVIGFCCEDCIPKFKKNPARYMKDLK